MKYSQDYSREDLLQPGIYCIENIINNKRYIGSSTNLRNRRNNHSLQLRKGTHSNTKLQRSVTKYGITSFTFTILEHCSKEKLTEREQYYVDIYEPEFNIIKNVADTYAKIEWAASNKDILREARAEYITYIWDTKTDQAYIIGDIKNASHLTLHSFCGEHNLTKESIRTAFNKGKNNYKHFVIYREYKHLSQPSASFLSHYYLKHKDFKVRKQRTCPYIYTVVSPKGVTYTIEKDTKGFCEEHNLDSSSFLKVARGKLKSVKGWKVIRQLKE